MQNPLNRVSALALLTALAVPALADWNTSDYGVRTRVDASQYDYGTFGDEVFGITPNGGDHQTSYMDQAGLPYAATVTSGSLGGFSLHSVSTADLSPGGASFAQAWSDVTIWDRVTLTNSTDGVLHVPIAVHFDGYATWRGSASYGLEIRGSDFTGEDRRRLGDSIDGYGTGQGAFYDLGGTTELVLSPHSVGTFKFIAGLSTRAIMGDDNSSPAVADFGHTMKMQWALPTGVTYTSQSGAFSPGAIQAVPEPSALAALAVGALGLLRRRATKK